MLRAEYTVQCITQYSNMKALIFALALVAVQATSDEELWAQFKVEHGKTYRDLHEEKQRFTIFQSSLRTIEEHNAKYENGEESYFLKVTEFADMTQEEFQKFLALSSESIPDIEDNIWEPEEGLEAPPASIDWRQRGAVLAVKHQGRCGACWAFVSTGYLEGQLAIKRNQKISLSEQNLIDCSFSYGNNGCDGGVVTNAFKYVKDNGINTEADYPYQQGQGSCRFNRNRSVTKVGKTYKVSKKEDALKSAIASVGPISANIDATGLRLYGGGIYNPSSCSSSQLNHGVLAVGYGAAGNQEYWIVKNSWGTGWGEQGYVRMIRNNKNKCGIASLASYADLK